MDKRALRRIIVALAMACLTGVNAQPPPAFEVASIKPSQSETGSTNLNTFPGGRLVAKNVSLKLLVQFAFGVKDDEIAGGPSWLATEKYDVTAKADVPGELKEEELRPFLQSLLAARFRLKIHRETRELNVYSLIVGKNGPKLTAHTGETRSSTSTSYESGIISLNAVGASMASFANSLGRQMARTVIDNTELQGTFDFKMNWAPAQTADSPGPSIFTAVQEQLGLKLESTKSPVEVVVIDSAEKASEN